MTKDESYYESPLVILPKKGENRRGHVTKGWRTKGTHGDFRFGSATSGSGQFFILQLEPFQVYSHPDQLCRALGF
jgi:hypothetical protein